MKQYLTLFFAISMLILPTLGQGMDLNALGDGLGAQAAESYSKQHAAALCLAAVGQGFYGMGISGAKGLSSIGISAAKGLGSFGKNAAIITGKTVASHWGKILSAGTVLAGAAVGYQATAGEVSNNLDPRKIQATGAILCGAAALVPVLIGNYCYNAYKTSVRNAAIEAKKELNMRSVKTALKDIENTGVLNPQEAFPGRELKNITEQKFVQWSARFDLQKMSDLLAVRKQILEKTFADEVLSDTFAKLILKDEDQEEYVGNSSIINFAKNRIVYLENIKNSLSKDLTQEQKEHLILYCEVRLTQTWINYLMSLGV
jgi:hypothetical protein